MKSSKATTANSDIYARLREARMNEVERRLAINALQDAEVIADAMLWLRSKVKALGALFLKPSLKH